MSDIPVRTVSDYIRKHGKLPSNSIKSQTAKILPSQKGHGLRHREQALNRLEQIKAQKRNPLPRKLKIDHSLSGTKNYLANRKNPPKVVGANLRGMGLSGSTREVAIKKALAENHERGKAVTPQTYQLGYGSLKKKEGTFS